MKLSEKLAIAKCEEIAEIMLPQLQSHGITVFNYYRKYFDGSVIRLSTDRLWTEHFFKKGYINKLSVPQSYLEKPLNYYIWLTQDCPEILLDAALNFDTSNGLSIAERHENYIESFCFATTVKNTAIINNFYLNHLDLLYKYCCFFRERARELLILSEKEKIIINSANPMPKSNLINVNNEAFSALKLTDRQQECSFLLLKGMKYKEIGMALNLSSRTVETHINHMKTKLNCTNRTELIVKLSTLLKI